MESMDPPATFNWSLYSALWVPQIRETAVIISYFIDL
jgi:hypothetical protein